MKYLALLAVLLLSGCGLVERDLKTGSPDYVLKPRFFGWGDGFHLVRESDGLIVATGFHRTGGPCSVHFYYPRYIDLGDYTDCASALKAVSSVAGVVLSERLF